VKTQTRQLVKPHQRQWRDPELGGENWQDKILGVKRGDGTGWVDTSDTFDYMVGKSYAVQPGRGKPGIWYRESDMTGTGIEYWQGETDKVTLSILPNWGWKRLRYLIKAIRKEDVRRISDHDLTREGFGSPFEFWETWVGMHDKSYLEKFLYASDTDQLQGYGFYNRSDDHYTAWVLEGEIVRD